ncbi:MAG: GNAT family N-acetyltransferase [Muribaculum sp.]|nr:GNAT family N-acetyltransferase [Ruminococcus flavefaciens]MCM1373643.1 GNAT family N-acetyltransferase [Muribaculum sp.]
MKAIEIMTERLTLKPLGSEYLETVSAYAMDYENTKYMCHLPNEKIEETVNFLADIDAEWAKEQPAFYEFAMLYQGEHIGAVSIYFENDVGELGWIVNKKYWRNGFAYEAAKAIVSYFAEHMGTTHFIAHCDTENTASWKVMEKLGMTRTGEHDGRRNRAALEDSFEYQYEINGDTETFYF